VEQGCLAAIIPKLVALKPLSESGSGQAGPPKTAIMRPLIFAALFLIFISACARPLFSKRASQCFSKDGLDMKTNVIAYGQFAGLAQGQCRLSGGEYFGCQVLWMKNRKDIKPEFDRMPGNDCFRAMVEGNDHYVFFKGLKTFSVAPNEISEDELENARTAARVTAISNLDKFK
jgi:hypothetical protein